MVEIRTGCPTPECGSVLVVRSEGRRTPAERVVHCSACGTCWVLHGGQWRRGDGQASALEPSPRLR